MLARIAAIALLLALLVAVPPFLGIGWQNAMTNMLIASLFAMAFNLLIGQAGLLSFGHAAFFGVGAFAALHLMGAIEDRVISFPTPLLPLAGAVAGFVIGAFAGYFATMRSGVSPLPSFFTRSPRTGMACSAARQGSPRCACPGAG